MCVEGRSDVERDFTGGKFCIWNGGTVQMIDGDLGRSW